MRKIITMAVAVVALAMLVAGVAMASAGTPRRGPVMYSGMGGGWQSEARRPHSFALGALWGLRGVSWSRWTGAGASGQGQLWACPSATGPCLRFRATVTLSDARTHNGTSYFATMTLTGKGQPAQRLVMDPEGGWMLTTKGYSAPG